MKFKEFMQQFDEVGTSTADVAGFKRISIPMNRRMWPPEVEGMFPDPQPKKKKRKPHRQPQVEE